MNDALLIPRAARAPKSEKSDRSRADGLAPLISWMLKLSALLVTGFFLPLAALAQGLITQRSISLSMAKTIAEATLDACHEKGFHTSAAVVDRSGQVLVLLRDEQAGPATLEMARRKAYTALVFRSTTLDFQKRTADPAFAAQRNVADILALGGGVPIMAGREIVGGVASSGSSQEMDDACAKAGLAKIADLLK